jgi:hypothetical protein
MMKFILPLVAAASLAGCNFNALKDVKQTSAGSLGLGSLSVDDISSAPAVGKGAKYSGQGALTVPTGDAAVLRLQNALGVSVGAGNFKAGYEAVKANLPKVTDPTAASGYDQVQLLAYAACSDLTTGSPSIMQQKYKINPKNSVASNEVALVSAGMTILDRHVASLASQGPAKNDVKNVYTKLVEDSSAAGDSATVTFMSVCMAANAAGLTLMGF